MELAPVMPSASSLDEVKAVTLVDFKLSFLNMVVDAFPKKVYFSQFRFGTSKVIL